MKTAAGEFVFIVWCATLMILFLVAVWAAIGRRRK